MRKVPILFAILSAIMLCAVSCKHTSVVEKLGLKFDTIHVEATTQLVDSGNSPQCSVSIDMITVQGDKYRALTDSLLRSGVLQPDYLSQTSHSFTPREAVDTFMKRYASDYREFYSGLYTADSTSVPASDLNIQYQLTTEIQEGRGDVLCHLSHVMKREGTVGTYYTLVSNMDMSQGKLVHLQDVFVPGYTNALNQAIQNRLEDKVGVKGLAQLRDAGYFVSTDVYATNNFILGRDHITFIYVPSEIADRAKGEVAIDVKYSTIKGILSI